MFIRKRKRVRTSLPLWDTSPVNQRRFTSLCPCERSSSHRGDRLKTHHAGHHSHEDARQEGGEQVPEELLHGSILLPENAPTKATYRKILRLASGIHSIADNKESPGTPAPFQQHSVLELVGDVQALMPVKMPERLRCGVYLVIMCDRRELRQFRDVFTHP